MKKFLTLIICILLYFGINISALAAENFHVFSEKASLIKDSTVYVPVKIENNKGIMGFRINLKYSEKDIKIMSVSKGTVVKNGNFNTSYTSSSNGSFDVVWNYTENVSDDGTVFVLGIKAIRFFEKSSIAISFSQEDTFNEKWEDVTLDCSDINLSCLKNEQTTIESTTVNTSVKTTDSSGTQISSEQIYDAVNATLSQLKYKSISDIKDRDKPDFVREFNRKLKEISGEDNIDFNNLREIEINYKSYFEDNFIQKASMLVDSGTLKAAIENSLEKVNVDDIKDIDKKKEKKFIKVVQDELQNLNPNIPSLRENIDDETALKAVKKLYGGLALIEADSEYDSEVSTNLNIFKYSLIAAVFVLIVAVSIFVIKAKKRKESVDKWEE